MSSLLIESFDHYTDASQLTEGGFTSAGTPTFSTGRYSRGRRVNLPSSAEDLSWTIASPPTEFFFGASIYLGQHNGVADTLVSFEEGGTEQLSIRVDVSGRLYVSRNGTTLGVAAGTGAVLYPLAHNYVELHALISDTVGTWNLYVNGISVTSGSAADTQSTANNDIDELVLHGSANVLPSFDCLYLNSNAGAAPYNGRLKDHELITKRPNGAGFQTDWTPVSAANWQDVDDSPGNDGDTTFVNAETANDIDSYTFEDVSPLTVNILSVQYKVCARGDSGTFRQRIRSVATDELATTESFNATYKYHRHQSLTDPNTAAAWTVAGWDAAQAGVELITV